MIFLKILCPIGFPRTQPQAAALQKETPVNVLVNLDVPFETIIEDESTWTIEDQQLLRIQLVKMDERSKDTCWLSLLKDPIQFQPDPYILNDMRKKLDLERFQLEVHDIQFHTVFRKLDHQKLLFYSESRFRL